MSGHAVEIFTKMFDHYKHSDKPYTDFNKKDMEHLLILTCIDKRITCKVLGQLSEMSYIYRNGGAATNTDDVVRTLSTAIAEAGIEEIIILLHTDCLFEKLTESEIRHNLHENLGPCTAEFHHGKLEHKHCSHSGSHNRDKDHYADGVAYQTFKDIRKTVIDRVAQLRGMQLISRYVRIIGMYYDVDADKIVRVIDSCPKKP